MRAGFSDSDLWSWMEENGIGMWQEGTEPYWLENGRGPFCDVLTSAWRVRPLNTEKGQALLLSAERCSVGERTGFEAVQSAVARELGASSCGGRYGTGAAFWHFGQAHASVVEKDAGQVQVSIYPARYRMVPVSLCPETLDRLYQRPPESRYIGGGMRPFECRTMDDLPPPGIWATPDHGFLLNTWDHRILCVPRERITALRSVVLFPARTDGSFELDLTIQGARMANLERLPFDPDGVDAFETTAGEIAAHFGVAWNKLAAGAD